MGIYRTAAEQAFANRTRQRRAAAARQAGPPPSGYDFPTVSWFTVPPADGVNNFTIYLDSAMPNDSGDGLSPATAKSTYAAAWALIGSNIHGSGVNFSRGDQLRVKCGSSFTDQWTNKTGGAFDPVKARLDDGNNGGVTKSGASWARPLVIGSYGVGDRPVFNYSADKGGLFGTDNQDIHQYVIIDDIEVNGGQPMTGAQYGMSFLGKADHILIQNCKITNFSVNLRFQADEGGSGGHGPERSSDFTMRGVCIADAHSTAGGNTAQGFFVSGTDGILIEFCTIDNNGYAGAGDFTDLQHNGYIQDGCTNITYRTSLSANCDGIQMKAGGLCEYNTFSRHDVALKNGVGDTPPAGGVTTTVRNCAFLENKNTPSTLAGVGLYLGNIASGTFLHLYFVGGTGTDSRTVWVQDKGPSTRGVQNTTWNDVISHDWGERFWNWEGAPANSNGNTMTSCVWQTVGNANGDAAFAPNYSPVNTNGAYGAAQWQLTGCSFAPNARTVHGHEVVDFATGDHSFDDGATPNPPPWFTRMGAIGCTVGAVSYPDPNRSLATYGPTIGLAGTHAAVMAAARNNRRGTTGSTAPSLWDDRYTGAGAFRYIQKGFGK